MYTKIFISFMFCSVLLFVSKNALAQKRWNKAYFGSPAVIPHGVEDKGRIACMHCHENGLIVNNKKTPITPHPELVNCRQCHVYLESRSIYKENSFSGLEVPERTFRPNPYAPPLIPHRTFLLKTCTGCHSNDAFLGEITQTDHPERQNCRQCHIEQIDNGIFLIKEDTIFEE